MNDKDLFIAAQFGILAAYEQGYCFYFYDFASKGSKVQLDPHACFFTDMACRYSYEPSTQLKIGEALLYLYLNNRLLKKEHLVSIDLDELSILLGGKEGFAYHPAEKAAEELLVQLGGLR